MLPRSNTAMLQSRFGSVIQSMSIKIVSGPLKDVSATLMQMSFIGQSSCGTDYLETGRHVSLSKDLTCAEVDNEY
jgi:hypothetical protein